jgi:hypothetical protein
MVCNGSIRASIALAAAFGLSLSGQDRRLEMPSSAITVSGCLQHATHSGLSERTPLGTTANPENAGVAQSPSAPAPGFLLTEAAPAVPLKASEPTGPTDRTETLTPSKATGTKGTLPTSYALDGNDVELAQHAGQRVEVTGTIAPPASPATGSSDKSSPMQSGVRRLQVTSIKQIATDCAPKTF